MCSIEPEQITNQCSRFFTIYLVKALQECLIGELMQAEMIIKSLPKALILKFFLVPERNELLVSDLLDL